VRIPHTLAPFFQEYDLEKVDLQFHKSIIIGRTLEFGTTNELRWLFKIYSKEEIIGFIKEYGYRKLSPKAFSFWRCIFKIKEYKRPEWLRDRTSLWRF
jgi:hypothetical protein